MPNILTNLVRTQTGRYGAQRVALTSIDLDAAGGPRLVPVSWGELSRKVDNAAAAMQILGIAPGDMVAIFAPNCPEILITDFGCYANRAVPVAIYATSSKEQVQYIVNDSKAKIIVVGSEAHYRAVREVIAGCPTVSKIIIIDPKVTPDTSDRRSMSYAEFLELGAVASPAVRAEVELRRAAAVPEDIATLIYTSGTTGEPKGAVLLHEGFNVTMDMHRERLDTLTDRDTSVCFLPLSHIFEKGWTYVCLSLGIRVDINGNPKRIQEAVRLAHPTCMCSVPRFWEKAYTAIQEKISHARGISAWMIKRALKVGARRNLEYARLGVKAPWWLEKQYEFFDRTVFRKVRDAMGITNPNIFPTAGAPLSARIVEFFHAIGINIVIGYGLSETTATVSCYPAVGYQIGTVGTVLDGIQVRIGENNEIQVKGPTVMREYYGRPADTREAFTADGWFRTGDAGLLDDSGAIVLTERLKDLFKTSNGKYIAPQAIESRLGEDRYIEQVAVIGDNRKYVTAIIIPAFEALKEYAVRHKIKFNSTEDLVENSAIKRFIAERIERLQKGFAGFEKIKRFTLLPTEFTIESGELTNTLKIRRPVINSIYADQIEAMYA